MKAEIRVGIVGAGIAGCSASYFVRDTFPNATITVFEKDERSGGRIHTIQFAGAQIELGAGFMHSSNQALINLIDGLALEKQRIENRASGASHTVGIWNGRLFAVTIPDRGIRAIVRLASRYGFSLSRMRRLAKKFLLRWSQVYRLQAEHAAFQNPEDLLWAVDLFVMTQQDSRELLTRNDVDRLVIDELFNGISRAIFDQDASINGVAGMVALAAAGLAGGHAFFVAGGNDKLCEKLLRASRARVRLSCAVAELRIDRAPDGRETVTIILEDGESENFDVVILATPIEGAALDFREGGALYSALQKRPSHITHVTCVAGRLSAIRFGVPTDAALPRTILTTEGNVPFSSILLIGSAGQRKMIYKIQSRTELDDQSLRQFFEDVADVRRASWRAFPVLKPTIEWPAFKLRRGLYYVNAMESVASTLETEVVASKNVVELMQHDFRYPDQHM